MDNVTDEEYEMMLYMTKRNAGVYKYKYPTTFDKTVKLETYPHYTDRRFNEEQTVFGKEHPDLHYDYDDRIVQWDRTKSKEAWEYATNTGKTKHSCEFFEAYLSYFFDKPVEIKHILAGVNRGNGCPYCVFGYRYKEN
jgi:hypothetical protein